jgi:ADP-heptose:LPS heptosyltransferase
MTKVLCILNGGMGDQILALPALKYLASTLPATNLEARIGGWKLRRKLFHTLLTGCSLTINSLEALQRQPRRMAASRSYDVIVDLDTRDPPYGAIPPSCLRAERAYFSFAVEPRIKKQISLELYDTAGSAFWQRCFEMAFRAACFVKRQACASDEMLACRDQFRSVFLAPPPASTRRRINRMLKSSRANQYRLAITPGGYNPPWKRWPIERFAEVIDQTLSRGVDIFVLGSPAEAQLARQLEELMAAGYSRRHKRAAGKLTFLIGRLEMEELPHLLQEMDLHLSNDNGVAHLGGILNRPQVILYRGLSSPHLSVGFNDVALFSGDDTSMQAISTAAVVEALEQMLRPRAK